MNLISISLSLSLLSFCVYFIFFSNLKNIKTGLDALFLRILRKRNLLLVSLSLSFCSIFIFSYFFIFFFIFFFYFLIKFILLLEEVLQKKTSSDSSPLSPSPLLPSSSLLSLSLSTDEKQEEGTAPSPLKVTRRPDLVESNENASPHSLPFSLSVSSYSPSSSSSSHSSLLCSSRLSHSYAVWLDGFEINKFYSSDLRGNFYSFFLSLLSFLSSFFSLFFLFSLLSSLFSLLSSLLSFPSPLFPLSSYLLSLKMGNIMWQRDQGHWRSELVLVQKLLLFLGKLRARVLMLVC